MGYRENQLFGIEFPVKPKGMIIMTTFTLGQQSYVDLEILVEKLIYIP